LAITSPTSGGRSVGIVRLWTQTMEFFFYIYICIYISGIISSVNDVEGRCSLTFVPHWDIGVLCNVHHSPAITAIVRPEHDAALYFHFIHYEHNKYSLL
jgi:hypothetical protein